MPRQPASLPFPARLRLLLAVYDLRANELARRAGIDAATVSRVLNAKEPCPPATAARLLRALHHEELREEHPTAVRP